MDDARFDRWTRGLAGSVSRRGLGALALGAAAAAGLTAAADAKKKKKKKGKKNKGSGSGSPLPPPPPQPRQCVELGTHCDQQLDTCCMDSLAAVAPICNVTDEDDDYPTCCLPTGTRTTDHPVWFRCCGLGWNADGANPFSGPGTCCGANDIPLKPGQSPELCCNGPYTFDGKCAYAPGADCKRDHVLCWDGSRCDGTRCPSA